MNYKKKSMSSPYQEQRDNGYVDRQMTEGWINGWVDEWMDGWRYEKGKEVSFGRMLSAYL